MEAETSDSGDESTEMNLDLDAPKLDRKQVVLAAEALLTFISRKKDLFEEGKSIYLFINLKKVPRAKSPKPFKLPLAHPFRNPQNTDICIFVKDPVDKYKQRIRDMDIPGIKKIISVTKLRTNFKQFEARRKLLRSYDLFLADSDLALVLPPLLGKSFVGSKKFPISVKLSNLKNRVEEILNSTFIKIPTGPLITVHIAQSNQTAEQITNNVTNSIDTVVSRIPSGWKNIQTLGFKTTESPTLPFFSQLLEEQPSIPPEQVAK